MKNKISIIIPVYNAEKFLNRCINSVLKQTYQNFEVIAVNDGSTDTSLKILKNYQKKDKRISIIDITNHGQGYARNLALKQVDGEFVMFLDSDDFIENVTLEVALNRIVEDKSDFVVFDWKYYNNISEKYFYVSKEKFFHEKLLENEKCNELIGIQHYFTVNKLYRKKYLEKYNIKYGEGYIYEDIEFWIKVVLNSKKVSILQSPLYNVCINQESTTKTNYETDKHAKGLLNAWDATINEINKAELNKKYKTFYIEYMLKKFFLYYAKRTPKKYKKSLLNDFFYRINNQKIENQYINSKFLNYAFKTGALRKKSLLKIFLMLYKIKSDTKKVETIFKRKTNFLKDIIKKESYNTIIQKKNKNIKLKNRILFMGFDYKYTGNSRYLYEEMNKSEKYPVYFVTKEDIGNENQKIFPKSKEFYEYLYSSKVVIFESWIPNKFVKPEGSIWINLWHGTPLKKMLFDSEEREIVINKPNHKKEKFNSLQKTDLLITDNFNVNKFFNTSFLFENNKILPFGYPRVKFLINNKNNLNLKKEIRKKLKVEKDKKIIAYLPTWRDYNYGENKEEYDFNYLLDKEKLSKLLGDDYVIISKDHAFLNKNKNVSNTNIETQELLLVTDYLITDYSSVMFDVFPFDVPVCLFVNDFVKYENSRGVYKELWNYLKPFVTDNEKKLAEMIKNYKYPSEYNEIKEKYCYNSEGNLEEYISKLIEKKDEDL